jgi:hypothetical protein
MVRSLERRVVALEEATSGDDGECPRCGWGGGDDDNHTYELTFIDPGGPDVGKSSARRPAGSSSTS